MQRLRASFASSHSGGTGAPPGVTRDPCQELADARLLLIAARCEARPGVEQTLPTMRWEAAASEISQHHKDYPASVGASSSLTLSQPGAFASR